MPPALPPARALTILGAALLLGAVALVTVAAVLQPSLPAQPGLEGVAYVAAALALLSPAIAALVRGGGLLAPELPRDAEAARRGLGREIAFFAVLEAAATLCAVALLLTPSRWPLAAALVPLATMAVNLRRS